ncbi:MAG: hypothetical protein ACREQL_04400, partial [Candidatus Binatia bacterium]
DGTVLIAGGSNDQGDLASTLVYDPQAGTLTPGASLSAARSGHTAILLPLNNSVLIAGGSAAGVDLASAELYIPWTSAAQNTAAMSAARSGAAGSGFAQHDGRAMVAGGSGLASSEYYGFATVKTDKDDYAPGEYANVTGSGWQPGETVTLTFHEVVDPPFHPDGVQTAVADAFGNISGVQYLLEEHDFGLRYYLTAVGASSQARTTFTDARQFTAVITPTSATAGGATSYTLTVTNTSAGSPTGNIGCVEVTIPSGVTSVGSLSRTATDPGSVDRSSGWGTATILGGTIIHTYRSASGSGAGDFDIDPTTGTIVINFTATSTSGTKTWTTAATSGGSATACTGVSFGISGAQPAVTVTGDTTPPTVVSINRSSANPTNAASVNFAVTFSESVTGVNAADFALAASGVSGASITSVSGSGSSYTVAVNTGSGSGTLGLNLVDDDSIIDAAGNKLGGTGTTGANNGSFTGQVYTIDKTKPVIAGSPAPAANGNGWNNTDVTVSFSCTDSGGSGIATNTVAGATLTTEGAGQSVTNTGSCTDNAGNVADSATVSGINLDKSAPNGVSGAPNRVPDHNGWYNSAVDVVFTGNGSISGIDSCTTVNYSGPDSATASVNGSCTDKAGNTSASVASSTFKYDGTGPSAALSVTAGTLGDNGWYTSNVTVHTAGSDAVSDNVSCTADQFQTTETTGVTFNGSCTNDAGLTTDAAPLTIKLDKSAPNAPTGHRTPDANGAGWNNSSVTVSFTDNGDNGPSDIASCTTDSSLTAETSGTDVHGTCKDYAGNVSGQTTVTVKIDLTKPVITGHRTPDPNVYGWNNVNVAVSFTCADSAGAAPSGIATDSVLGATLSGEGEGQSVTNTGSCVDVAGNTADSATVSGINIDKTPPNAPTGRRSVAPNGAGWNNTAPIGIRFTDNGDAGTVQSGIASCTAGSAVSGETAGTDVNGICTDKADNPSAETKVTVKIDLTKPVITGSRSPAANGFGWNNTDVAASFSCAETGSVQSGIATDSVLGATLSGEGAGQSVTNTGSCVDVADNAADPATVSDINIDKTAPGVTASLLRSPDHGSWYNHSVDAKFEGSDGLSGIASCDPNATYSGPDSASASVSGHCKDKADNEGTGSVGFMYDATAPSVTATPSRSPDSNGWYNHGLSVHYSATDTTSGVDTCDADSSYSGPDTAAGSVAGSCSDNAGNSASAEYHFKYDATAPFNVAVSADRGADHNSWYNHMFTATWTGDDALSGIASCTATPYSGPDTGSGDISGLCTDVAGNSSASVHFLFKYDATAPVLTLAFTPDSPDGNNGWWKTPGGVPFLWTCSDATSGIDGGYNGGCPSPLSGTETAQGTTNFSDQVRDQAGNLSVMVNRDLMLDNVAPTTTLFSRLPAANVNGWNNVDVTLVWNCSDGTSGPKYATDSKTVTSEGYNQSATGNCEDLAGNTSSHTQNGISIDKTKPTVTLLTPPAGSPYTLNQLVNASFSCNDSPSGFASNNALAASGPNGSDCVGPATVDTSNVVNPHTYGAGVVATDKAGNTSDPVSVQYNVNYIFNGFLPPIDNLPVINVANAGRVIPVKWQLKTASGALVSDLSSLVALTQGQIPCDAAPSDIVTDTLS